MSEQFTEPQKTPRRDENPVELGARSLAERYGRLKWSIAPETIRESYRTMARIVLEAQSAG